LRVTCPTFKPKPRRISIAIGGEADTLADFRAILEQARELRARRAARSYGRGLCAVLIDTCCVPEGRGREALYRDAGGPPESRKSPTTRWSDDASTLLSNRLVVSTFSCPRSLKILTQATLGNASKGSIARNNLALEE